MQIAFRYIISNSFNTFSVFKDFLINKVTILMMLAKMVTSGLLKIKVFQNKNYEVIVSVHDVIKKILSRDSDYIVDVVIDQSLLTLNCLTIILEKLLF